MELIELTDGQGHMAGVVIQNDVVRFVVPPQAHDEYSIKEFDRFVAAYRKARRVASTPAE